MRKLSNWMQGYREYSDGDEAPSQYHLWTALAMISTVLQRKNWLPYQSEPIFPNIYAALVGPPGIGKGIAIRAGLKLLKRVPGLHLAPAATSRESFLTELGKISRKIKVGKYTVEHSSMSVFSTEFGVFLGKLEYRFIHELVDLYDCPWPCFVNKLKTKDDDIVPHPYITILAGTQPAYLTSLPSEALGTGLAARTMWIMASTKRKKTMWPKDRELVDWEDLFEPDGHTDLEKDLIHDLRQIALLQGKFTVTEEVPYAHDKWYQGHSITGDESLVGLLDERTRVHAIKLAMLLCAARTNDKVINKDDWDTAIDLVAHARHKLPDLSVAMGRNPHGKDYWRIRRQLESAGNGGRSFEDLWTLNMGEMSKAELLEEVIPELLASGKIEKIGTSDGKTRYRLKGEVL